MGEIIKLGSIIKQNKDIDVSELDGQKVMMNIELGKYFMMNEVGSAIWDIIGEPRSFENIVNNLLLDYEVSEEECLNSVKDYLEKLYSNKLIEII